MTTSRQHPGIGASRHHRGMCLHVPAEAVAELTETIGRSATAAELDAFGYGGPVLVMQTVRTTLRADGTPIDKILIVQAASTPIVRYLDPADADDWEPEQAAQEPESQGIPLPRNPATGTGTGAGAGAGKAIKTYVIGMAGSPIVKIGQTSSTATLRMKQLQTAYPAELFPVLEVEGDFEKALHKRFAGHRVRGEWFDLAPLGDPARVVMDAIEELRSI
ncbi:GIY-YIG nuclease family protein [Streptomyces sp. NPDC001674]|uniref:GIY-YIG nuclease family protein n=1 Tax=Streptomyces sp. NPDC001674 TaxID=3154394 RepID=UPI003322B7E5